MEHWTNAIDARAGLDATEFGEGSFGSEVRAAERSRAAIDALGDAIAVTASRIDSATHELLRDIRAFDAAKGWAWQGAKSCAAWLSWRIGWGRVAAGEKVRVASALGRLPILDAAMRAGELSYCKVRALTRVATPANEQLLLEQARSATGAELERICRGVRGALRPERRRRRDDDEDRYVRRRHVGFGMVRIEAQLHADEAELVWQALSEIRCARGVVEPTPAPEATHGPVAAPARETEGAISFDEERAGDEPRSDARRDVSAESGSSRGGAWDAGSGAHGTDALVETARPGWADALVSIAEHVLTSRERGEVLRARRAAERRQIFLHVSEDRLAPLSVSTQDPGAEPTRSSADHARGDSTGPVPLRTELANGTWVRGDTLLRLACDAGLVVVKLNGRGQVLDVGRRRRTVSPALLRALLVRDRTCRFPGCCAQVFVEAHHVEHWMHGGATSLENTVLLCHRHHVLVHEGGFSLGRDRGGELQFLDPYGRSIPRAPRALVAFGPPDTAVDAMAESQARSGLAISARTALIHRDFRSPDLRGAANAVIARSVVAGPMPR